MEGRTSRRKGYSGSSPPGNPGLDSSVVEPTLGGGSGGEGSSTTRDGSHKTVLVEYRTFDVQSHLSEVMT